MCCDIDRAGVISRAKNEYFLPVTHKHNTQEGAIKVSVLDAD